MSTTPEPEMNLDLHFLPEWARQSPDVNRYAHYEGRDDRGRGRRPARGRHSDGPPRDRSRDRGPGGDRDRDRGRGRGQEGRPPRRGGKPGPGDRRGGRPIPRENLPPLPQLGVAFTPEAKGVESLARQIKLTGRAYPVFEIAHLILGKPERYQVTFSVVKNPEGQTEQKLWVCNIDNSIWLTMDEAVTHVLRRHFDLFYQEEKTPGDPPKGTYTFVAQCGLSGRILGPPNYHDYQSKLSKLHASRFSHMSLEAYKAKVRIVRDEDTVKRWVEEQSYKIEYVCLNVPEPLKLPNRDAAEKHFREVHAPSVIQSTEAWTGGAVEAQKIPSPPMRQLLRRSWEEQRRFPLRVVTVLSQQFANQGLQFFKVNKTVTHVCVARPHYLDLDASPVSDGIRRIVDFIQEHERCNRRDLVEALAPTPKAPKTTAKATTPAPPSETPPATEEAAKPKSDTVSDATTEAATSEPATAAKTEPSQTEVKPTTTAPGTPSPTPEQTAVVGDLHWLVHQGHVIEFANGRIELAKKPKPKPEPKPKAAAPATKRKESANAPDNVAKEAATQVEPLKTAGSPAPQAPEADEAGSKAAEPSESASPPPAPSAPTPPVDLSTTEVEVKSKPADDTPIEAAPTPEPASGQPAAPSKPTAAAVTPAEVPTEPEGAAPPEKPPMAPNEDSSTATAVEAETEPKKDSQPPTPTTPPPG